MAPGAISVCLLSSHNIVFFTNDQNLNNVLLSYSTIPIGKWSHIMIVWNERSEAKVFVNGTEAGRSSSVIVEVSRKITKNLQFNLGKKEVGDGLNKGNIKNFWKHF